MNFNKLIRALVGADLSRPLPIMNFHTQHRYSVVMLSPSLRSG